MSTDAFTTLAPDERGKTLRNKLLLIGQTTDPDEKARLIAELIDTLPKGEEDSLPDYSDVVAAVAGSEDSTMLIAAAADVLLANGADGFCSLRESDVEETMTLAQKILCASAADEARLALIIPEIKDRQNAEEFYDDEAVGYFACLKALRGKYPALDDDITEFLEGILDANYGDGLTLDEPTEEPAPEPEAAAT